MTEEWQFNQLSDDLVETVPIDGKEHYTGDECWCNPKLIEDGSNVECSDGVTRAAKNILHRRDDG